MNVIIHSVNETKQKNEGNALKLLLIMIIKNIVVVYSYCNLKLYFNWINNKIYDEAILLSGHLYYSSLSTKLFFLFLDVLQKILISKRRRRKSSEHRTFQSINDRLW